MKRTLFWGLAVLLVASVAGTALATNGPKPVDFTFTGRLQADPGPAATSLAVTVKTGNRARAAEARRPDAQPHVRRRREHRVSALVAGQAGGRLARRAECRRPRHRSRSRPARRVAPPDRDDTRLGRRRPGAEPGQAAPGALALPRNAERAGDVEHRLDPRLRRQPPGAPLAARLARRRDVHVRLAHRVPALAGQGAVGDRRLAAAGRRPHHRAGPGIARLHARAGRGDARRAHRRARAERDRVLARYARGPGSPGPLLVPGGDELQVLVTALDRLLECGAGAAGVDLPVEHARLERRPLARLHARGADRRRSGSGPRRRPSRAPARSSGRRAAGPA